MHIEVSSLQIVHIKCVAKVTAGTSQCLYLVNFKFILLFLQQALGCSVVLARQPKQRGTRIGLNEVCQQCSTEHPLHQNNLCPFHICLHVQLLLQIQLCVPAQ